MRKERYVNVNREKYPRLTTLERVLLKTLAYQTGYRNGADQVDDSIGGGGPDNEENFATEMQRLSLADAWVELKESPHDGHIWSERFDRFCKMVDERT